MIKGPDSGFLEGDKLYKSYNAELVFRVAGFLKPHRRWVVIASFLILASIGLELAMPFITRIAIDSCLVPYSLRLDAGRISFELRRKLSASLNAEDAIIYENSWYLSEKHWRKLDPSLTARLRDAGAVDAYRWYSTAADAHNEQLAVRYSDFVVRVEKQLLIAENCLQHLSKQDLKQLRRSDAQGLIWLALLFSVAALSSLAISFFQTVCLEQAGQKMMMDLRVFLYDHILGRSLHFFSRNPVGKLVTRINNDVQNISELFHNMLVGLFKDLFLFAGIAVVMFAMNARLASVCILAAPVMAATAYFFARISRQIFRRLKGYTGRLNTLLQETLAGMTAVKLLGAESAILGKLVQMNNYHFQAGLAQVKMFAVFTPLMELLGSLAVALIVWHGGGLVIQDRLSLGTLVAFIAYMQMLLVPIKDLSDKYNQLQGALASVERIFTVMDDRTDLPVAATHKTSAGKDDAEIIFQSVDFGYQPERKVFENFSLKIPKGQTVTLVGPSGGGKSTLVNLLLRLYDPLEGAIFLGGLDLKQIPPQEMARRIALVSQEIILLASTIEENITLGRQEIDPEMLGNALEISGVAAWMNELADGINTRVGEGGRPLSQGQRQMLSLARALAGNPRILILDEAFSQIDPDSEIRISSRLPSIMSGRTCITVAHRLSTARHSQRIIVMRNGRIAEDGNHRSLVNAKGIYADMTALDKIHRRVKD